MSRTHASFEGFNWFGFFNAPTSPTRWGIGWNKACYSSLGYYAETMLGWVLDIHTHIERDLRWKYLGLTLVQCVSWHRASRSISKHAFEEDKNSYT